MNNIYTDLNELPAFNWFRCIRTQDLTYLLVERKKKHNEDELAKVFQELNNQLIDELGFSDDHINYLHKLRACNIAKSTWLISQNNFDFTLMKIAEAELEKISKTKSTSNGGNEKISAERILGFRIDLKEVSVVEYYEYIKEADTLARSMSAKK
jgi:hypothetical protein